jgi:hypothetical protein
MKPIAVFALLVLLAGCAPQHGSPAPSAAPVSSAPRVVSAVGSSDTKIPVPRGARSAEIAITCGSNDDGYVAVGVDNQDQTRDGRCPLTMRFRVAVERSIHLTIDFARGTGRSVTEVRFSAEPFTSDPKVAKQCTGLSSAFSDTASAVNGYMGGGLDLAGWQKLMASASGTLSILDRSGAIGTQLTALSDWYGGTAVTPAHPTNDEATEAFEIVSSICRDNGSPLVIVSQYGG